MDPIPPLVRTLWDAWDVRILVLLSLTLQIILLIFGNRRKNISSLWFSSIVWLAYIAADWVATVALGNLSHAQADNNNNSDLRALWAPLLLVHLGGPDTITAYSLEDNQLWMRHFLGLVVQVALAVYVICLSWKNSWFSVLSIPALVAGIIKYGERTWVLKSVSGDESGDIVPFENLRMVNLDTTSIKDNYVHALVLAKELTRKFKNYMDHYDLSYVSFLFINAPRWIEDRKIFWKALEIEMGLMYDLLYTKATITYTKMGCILRCISFACTVFVLVGIFWLIFRLDKMHEDHYAKVDIAITGVLLVGALALEIYAVIVLFSSDWAMLWLIMHHKDKYVIQLRQQFSWLFPKKKWSKMMGQLNLLDYCVKDVKAQKQSRRIGGLFLRFVDKEKFRMYVHHTIVPIHLTLISRTIMDYCKRLSSPFVETFIQGDRQWGLPHHTKKPLHWQILYAHIITEMCYHVELERDTPRNSIVIAELEQNRELCKTLSHYVMYVLIMCPSLLPVTVWEPSIKLYLYFLKYFIKDTQNVSEACHRLLEINTAELAAFARHFKQIEKEVKWVELKLADDVRYFNGLESEFGWEELKFADDVRYFNGLEKELRWEELKFDWLRILLLAASKGHKNEHMQQLTQGGELLTFLWVFLPQSLVLPGIDPMKMGPLFNL